MNGRMMSWRSYGIAFLLSGVFTLSVVAQGVPRNRNQPARAGSPAAGRSGIPSPTSDPGGVPPTWDSGARTFLTQGQSMISQGRLSEAKEAFRTALRLEPMNLEAWNLYDQATELSYLERVRAEKRNPVVERDLKPLFAIEHVESYDEFGTLYLVGQVRNMSDGLRQNIELQGVLLDENKQELRRETGSLPLKDRGLFPNESSLFEIPFKNPPPGVKSYRVRIGGFD